MESQQDRIEEWFDRRRLTLDLVGLSEEQIITGSIFLGGSQKEVIRPEDKFDYSEVSMVVFKWGDKKAEDVFAVMLEMDDSPSLEFVPFTTSTIIGNNVWMLTLQDKDFDPTRAYPSGDYYRKLPFDEIEGANELNRLFETTTPRPQILGKVGTRWVLFGLGMSLDDNNYISTMSS